MQGWHGWDDYALFYDWENAQTVGRRDLPSDNLCSGSSDKNSERFLEFLRIRPGTPAQTANESLHPGYYNGWKKCANQRMKASAKGDFFAPAPFFHGERCHR